MDQLELLKQNWKQREQDYPKLSYDQIYDMLFKKSTSIVKWIFIISILELLFWVGITVITPKTSYDLVEQMQLSNVMWLLNIIHFIIILIFIYKFYTNYRQIKVTDSTHLLMLRIFKTRKTVKFFVIYNLVVWIASLVLINLYFYFNTDLLFSSLNEIYNSKGLTQIKDKDSFLVTFFVVQIIFGILLIAFLLIFYRIIYGILLKKLVRNYKELEKIEM